MGADTDREVDSSEERPDLLLQDAGKLLIFFAADNGMPMCPETFSRHTLKIASKTGISTDRLIEVYRFIQKESAALAFDKKEGKGGVGFKRQ